MCSPPISSGLCRDPSGKVSPPRKLPLYSEEGTQIHAHHCPWPAGCLTGIVAPAFRLIRFLLEDGCGQPQTALVCFCVSLNVLGHPGWLVDGGQGSACLCVLSGWTDRVGDWWSLEADAGPDLGVFLWCVPVASCTGCRGSCFGSASGSPLCSLHGKGCESGEQQSGCDGHRAGVFGGIRGTLAGSAWLVPWVFKPRTNRCPFPLAPCPHPWGDLPSATPAGWHGPLPKCAQVTDW